MTETLPDWATYKGPAPTPRYWWAVNPATKERTKVYRSYEDYADSINGGDTSKRPATYRDEHLLAIDAALRAAADDA